MENEETYAQKLKKTTRISGWLLVMLIFIGICGVFGVFMSAAMSSNIDTFTKILSVGIRIGGIFYFIVSCIVIYSFVDRQPNAIFLARTFIIYMLVINVMVLLNIKNSPMPVPFIIGLFIDVIWLIYLSESNQVDTVIPKDYRKYRPINTWIIVLLVLIPIVTTIVAVILGE